MDKASYDKRIKNYVENVIVNNKTSISAASASIIGTLVGYPFDSIKTRMQTYNYGKMRNCIKLTYRSEGLRGFYRGVGPPLITISIVKSISYSIYDRTKEFVDRYIDPTSLYGLTISSSIAGVTSGYLSAVISCPLELIKMQRQIEQLLVRQSSITASINEETAKQAAKTAAKQAAKTVAKQSTSNTVKESAQQTAKSVTTQTTKTVVKNTNGIRGLYRGFMFQGLRDAFGTGVYFCAYEISKKLLTIGDRESNHVTHFFAGGIAGIASWIGIFPIDLVKSKLQIDAKSKHKMYKNQLQCIKYIYKTSGVRGFYQGISSCLIRAFPVHALNFVVYEHALRLCKKLADKKESEID
ncbi:mitochondrial carrier [Anaeromyces robustus]|uniref:Mitochondrial carrier n=1 Tax=Anaeromyces robustus TaxID=1754192 RepID=A0A1Y1WY86_9FUNG|nr:mitochondrial carrier [Anaeromyces robustus]|eukprot:ORX78520.1 mitochondrial carrier [Anaeromyces robustus]